MKKNFSLSIILLASITASSCGDSKNNDVSSKALYERSSSQIDAGAGLNQGSAKISDSMEKIRLALSSAYDKQSADNQPKPRSFEQPEADMAANHQEIDEGQPIDDLIESVNEKQNISAPESTPYDGNLKIDTTVGILEKDKNPEPELADNDIALPVEIKPEVTAAAAPALEEPKIETNILAEVPSEEQAATSEVAQQEQEVEPVDLAKVNEGVEEIKSELGLPASFVYKRQAEYNVIEKAEQVAAANTETEAVKEVVVEKNASKKTNINQKPIKTSSILSGKSKAEISSSSAPEKKEERSLGLFSGNNNGKPLPVAVTETNEALPAPENAQPGQCYGKVVVKGETKEVEEEIEVAPERKEIVSSPAEYKEVEEEVVIKEASTKLVNVPETYKMEEVDEVITPEHVEKIVTPAKYKEVEEEVMVSPEQKVWEKTSGTIGGEVMKLVEKKAVYKKVKTKVMIEPEKVEEKYVPAKTKKVKKRVIDQPARQEKVEVPAVTKKIKKQVLVKDAATEEVTIPAETKKVTHIVNVTPDRTEWQLVVCDDAMDREFVKKVQGALLSRGYKIDKVDGSAGPRTKKAIKEYQESIGIDSPGITLKTLDSLSIKQ